MGKVRFGILLPDFPEDDSRGKTHVQNMVNYIDALDNVYESLWLGDHFTEGNFINLEADFLECLTTLTYLSTKFPDLLVAPLTLSTSFRNPGLLAKITSTLSVISDGKFIIGIGAGWNEEEYIQYGYDFPSNWVRIKQMEEAVQIIRLLWTQDNVTFKGKYHRVENAYCNPKPNPVPPILIGGGGEKYLLKAVAKYADWWNGICPDVQTWTHKLDVLSGHCDDVDRDFGEIVKTNFCCIALAKTNEKAIRLAKSSPFLSNIPSLIGSPDTIASQIGELIDVGVEYFQLYFAPFPNYDATQLFADEVVPKLS
jgi:alkanesulfonate monooxygenase SsuD/methylene tetrahydromethanopterin reductase-like flavin-dependent oxidoreductase (luciferase family)